MNKCLGEFQSLTADEMKDTNGGIGFWAAAGAGFLVTAVAAGVNEAVEDATGKDIFNHAVDGVETAVNTVLGWFR